VSNSLTIATRQSPLALWQAHYIKAQLESFHPGIKIHILGITTDGDRFLETDLSKLGGKGVFVKALEEALIAGTADIAVHSMKDVPVELPAGLSMPCIGVRASVEDAFVSNRYATLSDLPPHARIGTSSLRRHSQLKYHRADFEILPLRGNIQTRLQKLDDGHYDAIVLAAAGLERMQLDARIRHRLDQQLCLPAVGQGALGIECRLDDQRTQQLISPLNHLPTHTAVLAERQVNLSLGGSCHAPIGALAVWKNHPQKNQQLHLQAMVANAAGTKRLWAQAYLTANPHSPADVFLQLGDQVATDLKQQGALALLADHG
jgi:hydroxymethylbilane synthase